ncbi:BamA/TamA family outer membrane protein [Arcicella aquatica]|uniref:BamA/TamA family outer membrane protein n=1 Tax=Arcicella aquatica TaxID=217141 RepID=A0ABU5QSI8_9BACT|nr:BamA/TamA family outer membrane protein [Arcicella aquatica]MEA5260063.1 BamA/TamA family outer membrane protein [Arcicella aquatica]
MLLFTFLFSLLSTSFKPIQADSIVVVNEIVLNGHHKTKESIIFRELDFKIGDTLFINDVNKRLEINRRKIVNTNLFISVEIHHQITENGQLNIQIQLQEQWFLLGYPVFLLADRNFSEWWDRGHDFNRTIYGIDLIHSNFRGRAERLSLHLENGFTKRVDVGYRIPYINKAQKTGMGFSISYMTNNNVAFRSLNDTLFYFRSSGHTMRERFSTAIFLKKRIGFYDNHTIELRYNSIGINDTIRKLNPNYFANHGTLQRYAQLSYSFNHDFRDNVAYPLRGKRYGILINKLGILPNDDINQLEITGDYSYYRPLSRKWFFGMSIEAKISFPDRQPFYNTRGLGYGSRLVRGYELFVVDGSKYFYGKQTLRYELFNKRINLKFLKTKQFNKIPIGLYPTLFGDYGYVENRFSDENKSKLANKMLYSYGCGLDVVTYYNLVVRFNYAINSFNKGHFVFNIGREF